jgi:protein-arginine kinase activator protein McsA
MARKNKKNNKMGVKRKIFCPICGSTLIKLTNKGRFKCLNCKALFYRPKIAKIKIRKKPRYIG